MTTNYGQELLRFPLHLLYSRNEYYLERVAKLEDALADAPKQFHLELIGDGEIDFDWALVFRDVLNQRSAETKLITQARSTLKNGSVLVWLLGDQRIIREDARIFFRRANYSEPPAGPAKIWDNDLMEYVDSCVEADPEEASLARVLQLINEYLPVQELVGRMIDVPTLRQFGLIENEKLDALLTSAFRPEQDTNAAEERGQSEKSTDSQSQPQLPKQIQK